MIVFRAIAIDDWSNRNRSNQFYDSNLSKIRISGIWRYYVMAVAKFLVGLVVAFLAILLWHFVAALLMRVFGVRLPLRPFDKDRKRALQLLTFSQSIWCGILFNGCGMWIAMTLFEYLIWKYWNGSYRDFSLRIRRGRDFVAGVRGVDGFRSGRDKRGHRIAAGSPGSPWNSRTRPKYARSMSSIEIFR